MKVSYGKIIRHVITLSLFFGLTTTGIIRSDTKIQEISIGTARTLTSDILKENRNLLIYLPEDYYKTEKDYPVLYLLDGEWHFHHVSGILQFFQWSKNPLSIILVAVANTDRARDFSPTKWPGYSTYTGGATQFKRFLTEELIPYIDDNFRTSPHRILCGHSLAGTFTLFSFLTSPEDFDSYIALSPCLFWHDRAMLRLTEAFIKKHKELDKTIYIAHEYSEGLPQSTMAEFDELMKQHAPKGVRWLSLFKDGENHYSYVHKAIYDGLEFIFKITD